MLFKSDDVCQRADAKNQVLNTLCQKSNAKEM